MKCIRSLFAGLLALAGCSAARIEDYAALTPTLDVREFFNGRIEATGMFIDRSGNADPSFHAKMHGVWKGNDGTFEEHFIYSNGRKYDRVWTIHFTDDHHFNASAYDIIGGAKGVQYGNAMNMRYVMAVVTDGKTHNIFMDDWMYRVDEHTVLNRIEMTKFGFHVGEVIVVFRKS